MPLAIFIGIDESEAGSFISSKGKRIPHGDATYVLKEVHKITLQSFAIRTSTTIEHRFVAELRPDPAATPEDLASDAVIRRVDEAFDRNEFTMRQI